MPERVGLSAFLKFQGAAAIGGIKKASRAFSGMHKHAKMARAGVQDLQRGFAGFGIATAALGAGAVLTVKKFADFEGQMAAVKAVLGKEAEPSFERLEAKAMELGATTSFTGKQAAEAMENLARAGMDADQVIGAIGPTMAAAAADGMDLASAADIIASSMKSFGLEAKDTERIADTLAFVSRKTNTDIRGLGEGLKFVAPITRKMGISIEDSAAALGALADIGLKGTLAGTGLKNALLKLATSAKKGTVTIGKYKAAIVTTNDGSVNLAETMKNVIGTIGKIPGKMDRAAAAAKLLGLRGMGAEAAFEALGSDTKKMNLLFTDMAKRAKGTSNEMKEMRLKGFHGDIVRVGSAIDAASVAFGKMIAPTITPAIKGITKGLGDAAKILGRFWGAKGALGRAFLEQDLITQGMDRTVVSFTRRFVEGIKSAKDIFGIFIGTLKGSFKFIGRIFGVTGLLGAGGIGGVTKLAIQMGALALAVKVTTTGFSRMASVATGSFKMISGVIGGARVGLGGTLAMLGKYSPMAAKIGAKVLPRLTGVLGAAAKIAAQPVRVVNFDEMGGGIPGAGGGGGAGAAGAAGKGGAIAGAAKWGARLAAIPAAAYGALKLSELAVSAVSGKKVRMGEVSASAKISARIQAEELAKRQISAFKAGKKTVPARAGMPGTEMPVGRKELTKRITGIFRGARLPEAALKEALTKLDSYIKQLPTKEEWQSRPSTQVAVSLVTPDGKVLARTVAEAQEEGAARRGVTIPPGVRRRVKAYGEVQVTK